MYQHFSGIYLSSTFSGNGIMENLTCYRDLMKKYFTLSNGWESFFSVVTSCVFTYGLPIALLYRLWRKRSMIEYTVILFLLSVLLFPVCNQGFRYMFPLTFFIVFMMLDLFEKKLQVVRKILVVFVFITAVLGTIHYAGNLPVKKHYMGPPESELFSFIKRNTRHSDTFMFMHPRAFVLQAGRHAIPQGIDRQSTIESIQLFQPNYVVVHRTEDRSYLDTSHCVFQNKEYFIYALKHK
jgi:hypothetical protein